MKSSTNSSSTNSFAESFMDYINTNRTTAQRDSYYFVCLQGPLQPPVRIPWTQTDVTKEHKSTGSWCLKVEEERQQQKELENEGPRRLDYILDVVRDARLDIDYAESKKAELEQKEQKGEEVDYVQKERLRVALYDAGVAKSKIEKERQELYRLLNEEKNEVIRSGATEAYQKYLHGMKKLKREPVTPLNPSSPSLSSLKRSLGALT